MEADAALGAAQTVDRLAGVALIRFPRQLLGILIHHRGQRLDARKQTQVLEALPDRLKGLISR